MTVKVYIIESDRMMGQKIDEVIEFPDQEEAETFCRDYNNKCCPVMDQTPEWYMCARLEDQTQWEILR